MSTGYIGAPNSLARLAQKLEENYCLRLQILENAYQHLGADLRWERNASRAAMGAILISYAEVLAGRDVQ